MQEAWLEMHKKRTRPTGLYSFIQKTQRSMKNKQRRREGRKERKRQRIKKWLATEACEEIRLLDRNLWDSFDSECKPNLALALSRAIDSKQLKYYLAMREMPMEYDVFYEIKDVVGGAQETEQVMAIINDLKAKSHETDLPLEQVASIALYDTVALMLDQNRSKLMPWVEFGYEQLESWINKMESEWYLSSDVSFVNNPNIGDLMKAICSMGLSSALLDFVKWDQRVRHHIACELEVAPSIDYIKFNYPDSVPVVGELYQEDWETIWHVVYEHLPIYNHYKINILLDVNKPLHDNEDVKRLIKDFDLKPLCNESCF